MSNKRKPKKGKGKHVMRGYQGSTMAVDAKGRMHRVLSPGGLAPGAVAGPAIKRGLQKDYRDTCFGCLRPTDTGLVLRGPAEWELAFLQNLGLTEEEALDAGRLRWKEQGIWGGDPDLVPGGELTVFYRVCAACAPGRMQVREVHGELNVYGPVDGGAS